MIKKTAFCLFLISKALMASQTAPEETTETKNDTHLKNKNKATKDGTAETGANTEQIIRDNNVVEILNERLADRFFKILRCSNSKKYDSETRWEEVYEMKQALKQWKNSLCKLRPTLGLTKVGIESLVRKKLEGEGIDLNRPFNRWQQGEEASLDDIIQAAAKSLQCDTTDFHKTDTLARSLSHDAELVAKLDQKFNNYVKLSPVFDLKDSKPCKGKFDVNIPEVSLKNQELEEIQNKAKENALAQKARAAPPPKETPMSTPEPAQLAQQQSSSETSAIDVDTKPDRFEKETPRTQVVLEDEFKDLFRFYYGPEDQDTAKKSMDREIDIAQKSRNEVIFDKDSQSYKVMRKRFENLRESVSTSINELLDREEYMGLESSDTKKDRYLKYKTTSYGAVLTEAERLENIEKLYNLRYPGGNSSLTLKMFATVYRDTKQNTLITLINQHETSPLLVDGKSSK